MESNTVLMAQMSIFVSIKLYQNLWIMIAERSVKISLLCHVVVTITIVSFSVTCAFTTTNPMGSCLTALMQLIWQTAINISHALLCSNATSPIVCQFIRFAMAYKIAFLEKTNMNPFARSIVLVQACSNVELATASVWKDCVMEQYSVVTHGEKMNPFVMSHNVRTNADVLEA